MTHATQEKRELVTKYTVLLARRVYQKVTVIERHLVRNTVDYLMCICWMCSTFHYLLAITDPDLTDSVVSYMYCRFVVVSLTFLVLTREEDR